MSTRRRLNVPLSVLMALGVACGTGVVGGLVGAGTETAVEVQQAQVGLIGPAVAASGEDCAERAVPTPRLRAGADGACVAAQPVSRVGLLRGR